MLYRWLLIVVLSILVSGCSQNHQSGETGAKKPGCEVRYGWFYGTKISFNSDGMAQAKEFSLTKHPDGTAEFELKGLYINQTPSTTVIAEVEKMKVMVDLWDQQVKLAREIRLGVNELAEKVSNMANPPKGVIEALAKLKGKVDIQNKTFEYGSAQLEPTTQPVEKP